MAHLPRLTIMQRVKEVCAMAVSDSRVATDDIGAAFADVLARTLELKHLLRVVDRMAVAQETTECLDVAVIARLGSRATHELQHALEKLSIDSHGVRLSRKELFFLCAAISRLATAERVQEHIQTRLKVVNTSKLEYAVDPNGMSTAEILGLIDKLLCCCLLESPTEEPVHEV